MAVEGVGEIGAEAGNREQPLDDDNPADQEGELQGEIGDQWEDGVRQRMAEQDRPLVQPLCACRGDVRGLERLGQGVVEQDGVETELAQRQHRDRQHDMRPALEAADRQPVEPEREQHDQGDAEKEGGQRDRADREQLEAAGGGARRE